MNNQRIEIRNKQLTIKDGEQTRTIAWRGESGHAVTMAAREIVSDEVRNVLDALETVGLPAAGVAVKPPAE